MPDTSSYMDRWNNVSGEILRDPETDSIVAAERALDDEYTPNQEILEVFGASEMIEMRNDVILSSIPLTRRDIAHIYDVLGDEYETEVLHRSEGVSSKTFSLEYSKYFLIGLKTKLRKKFGDGLFLMREEMSEEQIRREVRRRFPDDRPENSHETIEQLKNMLTDIDAGLE